MKIGIISSGTDNLSLFKILSKYDHEYVIYYDDMMRPYGDRSPDLVSDSIKKGIDFLISRGSEKIILPPVWELKFSQESDKIMPLFRKYLDGFCFYHSLIGKIGLVGDRSDIQLAQDLIGQYSKTYSLTENQKNTKSFHFPFSFRSKEVQMRKYFLTTLSYSDMMANKIIKFDLRYFKDAGIDTIIPLNYGYFNYQKTISKYFNYKKCRFHKLDKLESIFQELVVDLTCDYSVSIFYTDQKDLLARNKKLMRLIQRGKNVEVNWNSFG